MNLLESWQVFTNVNLQKKKCVEHSNVLIQMTQVKGKRKINQCKIVYLFLLGYITVKELREVLQRLHQSITEERLTNVINAVDVDKDGKISYEEFVRLLEDS